MSSAQVTRLRNKIAKLYNELKQPATNLSQSLQIILELEKVSLQYIAALANDTEISYLDFYSIIDVLNDNITCLKETIINKQITQKKWN